MSDERDRELPHELRCKAQHKTRGRCKKARVDGMRVCEDHGAGTQASKDKRVMKRMTLGMARIGIDSSLRDPVAAFEDEFLRTVSRIAYLDTIIGKLTDDELVWGKISEDVVRATEWPGVNLGYGARVNGLVELQWRERQHLLAIEKIWLHARLDVKRLEIAQNQATALEVVMSAILAKLSRVQVVQQHVERRRDRRDRAGSGKRRRGAALCDRSRLQSWIHTHSDNCTDTRQCLHE